MGPGSTLSGLGRQCLGAEDRSWLCSLRNGEADWAQLLHCLSVLYVRGAEVNWEGFDAYRHGRRVVLPTYPFERQRYWVEGPALHSGSPTRIATTADGDELPAPQMEDWFYAVNWREQPLPEVAGRPVGKWVILPDTAGVGDCLATIIEKAGLWSELAQSDNVERTLEKTTGPVYLIDLRGLDVHEGGSLDKCLAVSQLVGQLTPRHNLKLRLWIVTAGAQPLGNRVNPWQAPLWGLGRTISVEFQDLWGGLVDLDPAAGPDQNAAVLWKHIACADREDQVALRGNQRLAARLERRAPPSKQYDLRPDGAYLITGGLGGLGLEVARWLVKSGARRLVLLSRTPLPPRREWSQLADSTEHSRVIAAIREMESSGTSVHSAAVDIGNDDDVRRFFEDYQRECWPPIRGVVHAAGVVTHVRIEDIGVEHLREVFRSKVDGAWLLHQVFEKTALDFFVLFSSGSALVGLPQLGPYAAANSFLDGLACYRRDLGLPALSVNWGSWSESGMAARFNSRAEGTLPVQELGSIKTAEGLHCLARLLGEGASNVAVLPGDFKKWAEAHQTLRRQPFLDSLLQPTGEDERSLDVSAVRSEILSPLTHPGERRERLVEYLVGAFEAVVGFQASIIEPLNRITDCGIDSLMVIEFRNRIAADLGIGIPTKQLMEGPTLKELADRLIRELPEGGATEARTGSASVLEYPLCGGQQAQWFRRKFIPNSATLNIAFTAQAAPQLKWDAFQAAVDALAVRHPMLRASFFETEDGRPMQRMRQDLRPHVTLIDATKWDDDQLHQEVLNDFNRPFDFDHSLLRVSVFRRADSDIILFNVHHIIMDAWSLKICFRDLKTFYVAAIEGTEPALERTIAGFHEFVEWEASFTQGPDCDRLWAYWSQQLSGELPLLRLPSSRPKPSMMRPEGDWIGLAIDPPTVLAVRHIAREYNTTPYSVLLAVFQVLLYRYCGQDDVIVGTSAFTRDNPRWMNLVGYFINLLPIRADMSGNPTFEEHLVRCRETVLGAIEHQQLPFPLLVARLRVPRSLKRTPVFQAFFNYLTDRSGELSSLFVPNGDRIVKFGNSALRPYLVVPQQLGQSEVVIQMFEVEGRFVGFLNYNVDVLDHETAAAMAADYSSLLAAVTLHPKTRLDELPIQVETAECSEEFIL